MEVGPLPHRFGGGKGGKKGSTSIPTNWARGVAHQRPSNGWIELLTTEGKAWMAVAVGGIVHGPPGMDFEEERNNRIRLNQEKMAQLGLQPNPTDRNHEDKKTWETGHGIRSKREKRKPTNEGPKRRSNREKKTVDYREIHDSHPGRNTHEDEVERQKRWNERVAMAMKVLDPEAYERAKRENKEKKMRMKSDDGRINTKNRGPVDSGKGIRVQGGRVYDSKNGVTCHWCRQKTVELHVTCTAPQCAKGRMPISFCERCLRNRHGEDIQAAAASGKWVCPKCRGSCGEGCVVCCNCGPCRKKHGLGPTFQLISASRKAGFTNVHDFLVHQNTKEDGFTIAYRKVNFEWGKWLVESMAGSSDSETAEQDTGAVDEEMPEEHSGEAAELDKGDDDPRTMVENEEDDTITDAHGKEEGSDATQSHGGVEAYAPTHDGSMDEVHSPVVFDAEKETAGRSPCVSLSETEPSHQKVMPEFMKSAKVARSRSRQQLGRSANRVKSRTRLSLGNESDSMPGKPYVTQAAKRTKYSRDAAHSFQGTSTDTRTEPLWTPPIHSKLVQMQMPLGDENLPCLLQKTLSAAPVSASGLDNIGGENRLRKLTPMCSPGNNVDLLSYGTRIRFAFGDPKGAGMSDGVVISNKRTKASFFKVRFEKEGVLMVKLTQENHGVQWVCA